MAMDTPARIAVIGAGPMGLEAALYARYLGYQVDVYERGRVGQHARSWAHVTMFTPFSLLCSPLGLAALQAQNPRYQTPAPDAALRARQWLEAYLLPLAETDLLNGRVHEQTAVVRVGRVAEPLDGAESTGLANQSDADMGGERAEPPAHPNGETDPDDLLPPPFEITLQDAAGERRTAAADLVIDASGVWATPRGMGARGEPVEGEAALAERIEYGAPDVLDAQRAAYAGRHTLLVGAGCLAQANAVALARLADEAPETQVTWICRDAPPETPPQDDVFPIRAEMRRRAAELARGRSPRVRCLPHTGVRSIAHDADADQFAVRLAGAADDAVWCDRVIVNAGHRRDPALQHGVDVDLAAMDGRRAAARNGDAWALASREPDFYVLGAKSFARPGRFLVRLGLEQIRTLFALIGDRPDLDLYANAQRLIR